MRVKGLRLLRRAVGLMKKLEMNQLNYRLSHPAAALQTNLAKDMDKYSRIRFDYASFDAQVFGKQPLMGANPEQEMSPFSDCELFFFYVFCIGRILCRVRKAEDV